MSLSGSKYIPSLVTEEKEISAAALIVAAFANSSYPKKEEEYIRHLAAIVESSDDAIISKSLDGIIKSWNKGGEKMFGYTAQQAIGKHISLIIPPAFIDEEKKILEKIRNNETIEHYETVRVNKNGEQLQISLTVSPLKDGEGNIIGASKIARDISSRKRSEADLIHANEQLVFINQEKEKWAAELIIANKELVFQNEEKGKRAAELTTANRELVFQNEEKEKRAAELLIANKELEQLTYIASHDLQEPLRTICNYVQVFEEDYSEKLDDAAFSYVRSIHSAAKRMSALVKGLLSFSRLGHNKILSFVNTRDIASAVIADLHTLIQSTNAMINVGDLPQLNAYQVEFSQLLQNLITNAIKFQKKDTRPVIEISSQKDNDKWIFSVRDNGIGIEAVHFNRIFDIFQRLHVTSEYDGYGIGLANCKKIVELHHGRIWVESMPGEGTVINFTIPNLHL